MGYIYKKHNVTSNNKSVIVNELTEISNILCNFLKMVFKFCLRKVLLVIPFHQIMKRKNKKNIIKN